MTIQKICAQPSATKAEDASQTQLSDDEKYYILISKARTYFNESNYCAAIKLYDSACKIKPGDMYGITSDEHPKNMSDKISAILLLKIKDKVDSLYDSYYALATETFNEASKLQVLNTPVIYTLLGTADSNDNEVIADSSLIKGVTMIQNIIDKYNDAIQQYLSASSYEQQEYNPGNQIKLIKKKIESILCGEYVSVYRICTYQHRKYSNEYDSALKAKKEERYEDALLHLCRAKMWVASYCRPVNSFMGDCNCELNACGRLKNICEIIEQIRNSPSAKNIDISKYCSCNNETKDNPVQEPYPLQIINNLFNSIQTILNTNEISTIKKEVLPCKETQLAIP